ncbi:hypothetical protein M422DRAFT_253292 [Sphaerobolus stellatus SS14]|uniref:Uncharacterized protein n=1 Tax=Sphaerobolus stellatus (strain SS14) TaxID=990650 RepID=A0A0C9VY97_SPHS4|nr:hypothetical protein M422DRAFT_253292 [Sphaerobolus stellatus SS14]
MIQLNLQEIAKDGYIKAEDIVTFLSSPAMQEQFPGKKLIISIWTAYNWLHKLEWRFGKKRNGMYTDGHEKEDVDNEGNATEPNGFPVEGGYFQIIMVTHDEPTFFANDCQKTKWTHANEKAVPEPKGEGQSLMVSDLLTPEWGQLVDGDEEAYLLQQVDKAIDVFEGKTKGHAFGLFLFDNAPSHQQRAAPALSARRMPKGPSESWAHHKSGPRMCLGKFSDDNTQDFYYPDNHPLIPRWFKRMEQIIEEYGLWPEQGLNAQCEGFKCEDEGTDCCCWRLLFT